MKALDFGNWTKVPTPAELECAKKDSFTRLIIGASYGNVASMQLKAGLDAGMEIQAFSWLKHPFVAHTTEMITAFNHVADLPITRMWVDVEDPTLANVSQQQAQEDIYKALEWWHKERPDLPTGLYTAEWVWKAYLSSVSTDFGQPLWAAYYPPSGNNIHDLEAHLPNPWILSEVDMWQYAGSRQDQCIPNVDLNLILADSGGRVKYTDEVLDKTFTEIIKAIAREGDQIGATVNGLASVAKTVADLQTRNGDAPTSVIARLNEMEADMQTVQDKLKKYAEDAAKAAQALNA